MVEPHLTAAEATSQIIGLINSRPATPWPREVEAIIARVNPAPASMSQSPQVGAHITNEPFGPVTPELAAAFFAWDQARIRDSDELDDHEARARQDIIAEKTAALFAIGVRSFADLRLLVPVVAYWNSPGSVKSPDYPECILEPGGEDEGEGFEPKSVAYLVRAVIGLLGMGGVASSIPIHARQDDPTLAALQERLCEVDQLHDKAKRHYDAAERLGRNRGADPALAAANEKADRADLAMMELSKRIFAARPISLRNLKLRATIAKYWQGLGDQGEKWTLPEQCTDWESEVVAHLIDGVLRFDAPPDRSSFEPVALPSPELALFQMQRRGFASFSAPTVSRRWMAPNMIDGTSSTASAWTGYGKSPRASLRARRRQLMC